jgi:hypothetical protein
MCVLAHHCLRLLLSGFSYAIRALDLLLQLLRELQASKHRRTEQLHDWQQVLIFSCSFSVSCKQAQKDRAVSGLTKSYDRPRVHDWTCYCQSQLVVVSRELAVVSRETVANREFVVHQGTSARAGAALIKQILALPAGQGQNLICWFRASRRNVSGRRPLAPGRP